ncbi:MAG: chromosomal replication initiator protein DnaA [Lachnospiraceae bacterium]|nr:chromosomal replication initiator protein DnaA [Lachnospiraceae bacterium]
MVNQKIIEEKWMEILNLIEVEHNCSPVAINSWIKPLTIHKMDNSSITFLIGDKFDERAIQFIKSKMYDFYLQLAIEEVTGNQYDINFILASDIKESQSEITEEKENPSLKQKELSSIYAAGLNPSYTFDNFVIGETNKHAHAAAVAVAESPAKAFNPLFLYSGAGLGKTHLMHSIGNYVIKNYPELKVFYVPSDHFTNEIIEAIRKGRTKEFRDKYRQIDVILIDDIQFLIGKERTQEEFFHIFNYLRDNGKQIVISSDKPPKDIETLEERLRTRFEWGVTVDIQPPDYETRMAILQKKAELDGLVIPNEVMQYIATNIKSSIREIEGALNKICVYANLERAPITLELAQISLKDLISNDAIKAITLDFIINTVSDHYNVSYEDLLSTKRSKDIAYPRQVAMYLCRQMTTHSLQEIGNALGDRDHSTVMNGIRKIDSDKEINATLRNTLETIKKKISG